MKGIDLKERREYVAVDERGKADHTTFIVGNLSLSEQLGVFGDVNPTAGEQISSIEMMKRAVPLMCIAIKSIKNLGGVDYAEGSVTREVIESIPPQVAGEIFVEVMKMNSPTEQEVKN